MSKSRKVLKLSLSMFLSLVIASSYSQDFLGLSTGNYAGVTGVMLQPASIVDSRYKFDINLFSTGNNFNNNYLQVSRKALLKFNSKNFSDYKTFKDKYLSEASLANDETIWFDVNSRIQMPLSFMASLGEKSAIALNIQNRSMVQGRNISQELGQMAYNEFYYPPLNNMQIDASGFSVNTLNWLEVGLTYGQVIFSSDKHFLKGAITAKYLGGVASLYMGSNDLQLSVNNDSSINFNTSAFEYARNDKADFDILDRSFKPDANTIGFDAGLVYEFRGNADKFKYISRDDQKSVLKDRRDVNKYVFKVGVSLLDVGGFNFDKAPTAGNFSGSATNWNLNEANYNNISDFDTALANRTTRLPNDPRNYKVSLPTALSVQVDLRLIKGVYLNAMAYRPIQLTKNEGYRFNNYGYYSITPRWESRHFGIYLPYTFTNHKQITDYKQNVLGATVRLGPVFVGSSNLGTMLFNDNLKGADVHAGLKVGITYGKPNKASQLIEKLIKKDDTRIIQDTVARRVDTTVTINKRVSTETVDSVNQKNLPLIIDYKNGQIYTDPSKPGNIIIINNNSYNNVSTPSKDSSYINVIQDSIRVYQSTQSAKTPLLDSTQRRLNDSLNMRKRQLDSTIQRLEELRKALENQGASTNNNNVTDSSIAARSALESTIDDAQLNDEQTTSDEITLNDQTPRSETQSSSGNNLTAVAVPLSTGNSSRDSANLAKKKILLKTRFVY